MTPDSFTRVPENCDAFQAQLSEIADSGAAPPPALRAHLDECGECARFAAQWLQGPPAELARSVPVAADVRLRERILDAAALPGIIRFPAEAASPPVWIAWLSRAAAGLVVAGLAYTLLDPAVSPVEDRTATAAGPTLSGNLARLEDRTKHEQAVLQTALIDGGSEVRGNVAWSVSALDL